jgi:pimeloyl-ACP methyl ester carboxylesterase
MKKLQRVFLTTALSVLTMSASYAQIKTHPTMVLVHGALLTSSSWAPVQSVLQNNGYNVVTVDTPGRVNDGVKPQEATLSAAVTKVCRVVNLQAKPVILVGHSQAGAIITEATEQCGKHIAGLIYVAAVVPKSGEKPFDMLSEQDNKNFDLSAPLDEKTGLSIPNPNGPVKSLFMGDATEADAKIAINAMVPESITLAYNALNYDEKNFQALPKYYIKTAQDLIIAPASQDTYINREKMNGVIILQTSHSPFVSQPRLLAEKLMEINDKLSK